MKKKAVKHHKKTSSVRNVKPLIPSTRIIIIGSAFAVLFATFVVFDKPALRQSVQGISIIRGAHSEAIVSWQPYPGAVGYNIYYDVASSKGSYTNAVRNIPASMTSYTVQYLKNGVSYKFKVVAIIKNIHNQNAEIALPQNPTVTIQSM